MPLLTAPKANSASSPTPSRVMERQSVSVNPKSGSTARVEALKTRLSAQPPPQPIAPRAAGSSARREELGKLNQFQSAPPKPAQSIPARTPARLDTQRLGDIEPPPSGLADGQELTQPSNTIETPEAASPAKSEPLSPQYVALARQEQSVRKAQRQLKADQDAWKQQQAGYISKEDLIADPLKALSEAGITPDRMVELQIDHASAQDPQQQLLNKVASLEKQLADLLDPENGTLAKRDQEQYDQTVAQIRQDAQLVVESNPSYGTIKSEGQAEEVVKLIVSVFEAEGTILDVEEAAQLVEDKLVETLSKQYERLSQYEKIKAKLGTPAEPEEVTPPQQTEPVLPTNPRISTLTNNGSMTRTLSARDKAVLKVQAALDAAKGR